MIPATTHIIGKQTIEIDFDELEEAMGVQNRISELFHERLLPGMELLFDEMVGPEHRAVIERLEIDCGELLRKNWEQEWVENVLRALKAELIAVDKKRIMPADMAESFFFFLQHGRLPWNARIDSIKSWEEFMELNAGFVKEFLRRLYSGQINKARLSIGFSKGFLNKLIRALIKEDSVLEERISSMLHNINSEEMLKKDGYLEILKIIATAALGKQEDVTKESAVKQPANKLEKPAEQEEFIYIENAGIVILHPFFPQLFEDCGLIGEEQWLDEKARQVALQMMGFLVKGNESTEEFDMALYKILCGVEIQDVIAEEIRLTDNIRRSCEELLGEVIGHWKALKNTGIETFRETFLNRAGKLSRTDNGWLLQVEQKGVDVLMNKLPWGIGTIKLPWMHEIVYTEWAY
jgi:hypothetical protein